MSRGYAVKQVLSARQAVNFAPQLQQGVRTLQLSSAELQNEIDIALQSNPFLEKTEIDINDQINIDSEQASAGEKRAEFPQESTFEAHANRAYPLGLNNLNIDTSGTVSGKRSEYTADTAIDYALNQGGEQTLHEFLHKQAHQTPLSDRQHFILGLLIDSVSDKGYLRATVDEIVQFSAPEYVVSKAQVAEMILVLQDFEPAGVGARTSSECLTIQLNELPPDTQGIENARLIVSKYLLLLAKKENTRLAALLGINQSHLTQAVALIRQLNPFPGLSIAPIRGEFLVPDLSVKWAKDKWRIRLNPNITPAIGLHRESVELLDLAKGQKGYDKLKLALQDARTLLSNIKKRYQTLLKVAVLIVDRQGDALHHGAGALKPLTQKEIADILQVHVSTVSRAVNDKYMLTPQGVVELRSFFCTAIEQAGGEHISSNAIQAQIEQLVIQEPRTKPYSDSKITAILKERGIAVARRTVMKYRKQLGIPASPKRRMV